MSSKIQINYVRDFNLCDRNHFKIVKGIAILTGLAVYLCSMYMNIPWLKYVTTNIAALFLFCSGYGVSESFERKQGLVHYWENKVIKVWLPSLIVMTIVAFITNGSPISWISKSPVGLKGNVLYVLFGAYSIFWLLFAFIESRNAKCLGLLFAAIIACFFVTSTGILSIVFCFPAGVIFSQYKLKHKMIQMRTWAYTAICLFCLVLAAGSWALVMMTEIAYVETVLWSVSNLSTTLFVIFAVYGARQLPVFGVFVPFGYMAFGIYLVYDSVLSLLNKFNSPQAFLLILGLLFLISGVLSWLRDMLVMINKDIRRRKNPHLKGSMWK